MTGGPRSSTYLGTDQGAGAGGRAALTRLDRDVLSVPGIKTVVVTQSPEDIVAGHDDVDVDSALGLLREAMVAVTDTASTADPQALKLGNDAAPADYDSGDHLNLTADGYITISNAYDLTALGPDA